ncbi:hypothetical protein Cgig2_009919 [Carnegiea gigantea]|uniref:Uncharacterized protein n=1 Tax=Carnegiea gigantea TaxID=171969 RepID=A0A9Q1K3X3_9CARY|nr:hypothetical protein Cgig2_009919 [Carnegiea gigantea]
MVFPDFLSTERAADYVRETFKWYLRRDTRPLQPLPANYHELCWHFDLTIAEESAWDFCIFEMIQDVFYAMTPDQLMVEGSSEGNYSSASSSRRLSVEARSTSISSSERGGRRQLFQLPFIGFPFQEGLAQQGPQPEVIAKGTIFLGAPQRSNPQDRTSIHFPNLKFVSTLQRPTLEKKYLLPAGYKFIIPDADAIINRPPSKCIVIYRTAFSCGVRFLLHPIIVEILSKYELALAQIMPMSWRNICSFMETCVLHRLACMGRAFGLVHTVYNALSETGDLGWYCFNNKKGFMTAIERKSKDWNDEKLVRSPFSEPTAKETKTARYFQYYLQEDDRPEASKLAPCCRKPPAVSLNLPHADTRKHLHVDEGQDAAVASAPTPLRALAPSGLAVPFKVTEEQVAIAESVSPGICSGTKGRRIDSARFDPGGTNPRCPSRAPEIERFCSKYKHRREKRQLEEARSKVEAEIAAGAEKVAKAEHQGYWRGHEDHTKFFQELLVYVEDRRQAQAEDRNLELVDFTPSATDKDDLGNKETTPLDSGAATSDGEGHDDEEQADSNNDEDPNPTGPSLVFAPIPRTRHCARNAPRMALRSWLTLLVIPGSGDGSVGRSPQQTDRGSLLMIDRSYHGE